ncbi:hypothetical protein [Nonomuraea sp. NPDC049158]|uniref:hypothetical protein n=1 Tax=Nonomuraea sp. NPDC049158 TaxID=3155649 RepID=UPI0033EAE262
MELAASGTAAVAIDLLSVALGWGTTIWVVTGAVAACLGTPPIRLDLLRRARSLLVRHRFQGLCLRTSLRTTHGRLPLVLHTTRAGADVLMLIWCRSGMTLELFESYREEIKVACYAKDVGITAHARWSHVLVLEILF